MLKRPNADDFHEKLRSKIDGSLPGKFVFVDYIRALEAYINHLEGTCSDVISIAGVYESRIEQVCENLRRNAYSKEQWMDFLPDEQAGLIMSSITGEKASNTYLLAILENWDSRNHE